MGKKGRKELNPADAYRKEQRKREIKKNKKDRKRVRELGSYIKDPSLMKTEIEKMERMQGSGTLDHKLVGKLQQLQQLYPSIVKLHQRKQAMVNRGASVDEDTLEQMLDDIEAEGHAAAAAVATGERGGSYRKDPHDQYRGAGPVPGRPPPPLPPHAQVHPMLPSPIPLVGAIPPPPPGPPPGYARGPPSLPPPVGMVMGPHGPMPLPHPLPPPGAMPMPIPPPRPPGPPPGYTGLAPPPPPGAPSAPSPTPGAHQPGLLPTPPPQGPPPRGGAAGPAPGPPQQHRVQTVADPLDPGAVNYGEYRKFSYVEHHRPGAPPPRPPPMMGPQMGPMAGPPRGPPPGPSMGPSMGPAAGPPPGPEAGPDLGPVMGPSKPKPVDKDLVAFMPASLRVKRPTAAPSASGASAGGAGLMRPRSVTSSKVVAGPKAPGAAAGAGAGAAAKPKQAVGDSYDEFMQELSGLL